MQWVSTKEVRISSNNKLSQLCNPVQYDTVAFFFWNQPVTVPPPEGDGHGGGEVKTKIKWGKKLFLLSYNHREPRSVLLGSSNSYRTRSTKSLAGHRVAGCQASCAKIPHLLLPSSVTWTNQSINQSINLT